MPRPPAARQSAEARAWDTRLRSREFKRALTDLIARELKELGRERVGDVIDAGFVRTLLSELDIRVLDRTVIAELGIDIGERLSARLEKEKRTPLGVLDRRFVADIEAALDKGAELPPQAEELVATVMRSEFVSSLLTDVTYTAIASFYERVNPLFGALATRALEDQIKGFIRLFMPMLQARAIAFVVDRSNQRLVLDAARAVVRQLGEVPIGRYAALARSGRAKTAQTLIRKAAKNAKLAALVRDAAVVTWDEVYATIEHRRIGDLVRMGEHSKWLAERAVEVLLPLLSRPHVRRFAVAEMVRMKSSLQG